MNKVDFFFQMLRGIYGASKVSTTWPTDLDMQLAKKLWQAEIERHSEAELRAAIDHAKRMIGNCEDEWMWPNIGVILTGARQHKNTPEVHALLDAPEETPEERLSRKEYGKFEMAKILDSLKND